MCGCPIGSEARRLEGKNLIGSQLLLVQSLLMTLKRLDFILYSNLRKVDFQFRIGVEVDKRSYLLGHDPPNFSRAFAPPMSRFLLSIT